MTGDRDKALLLDTMRRNGGKLPSLPDGPTIANFNARKLADAIQSEVSRFRGVGKITLTMDMPDAMALVQFLRRRG